MSQKVPISWMLSPEVTRHVLLATPPPGLKPRLPHKDLQLASANTTIIWDICFIRRGIKSYIFIFFTRRDNYIEFRVHIRFECTSSWNYLNTSQYSRSHHIFWGRGGELLLENSPKAQPILNLSESTFDTFLTFGIFTICNVITNAKNTRSAIVLCF